VEPADGKALSKIRTAHSWATIEERSSVSISAGSRRWSPCHVFPNDRNSFGCDAHPI